MAKIAIITGASSGLGLEFAKQIDSEGEMDEIWLLARSEDKLNQVAGDLHTLAIPIPTDLSNTADIATIAEQIDKAGAQVAYLVNGAGFGKFGSWKDISDSDVWGMIDLNCKGLVAMTKACLPYMSKGSKIIQIASAAGFMPLPNMNVYAATKAFVLSYTKALRYELAGSGITVTALCPTWVKTGFEDQARKTQNSHAVNHLLFAQSPKQVVSRALLDNRMHLAVSCASIQSFALRLFGKVLPSCVTMAGWDAVRRL